MTMPTVKLLITVLKRTICAASPASTSYSRASVELLRDVGNELAIQSDWAVVPSIFNNQINNKAATGEMINRPNALRKIRRFHNVFTLICASCAPSVINAIAINASDK